MAKDKKRRRSNKDRKDFDVIEEEVHDASEEEVPEAFEEDTNAIVKKKTKSKKRFQINLSRNLRKRSLVLLKS